MASLTTFNAFKSVLDSRWTDTPIVYENEFAQTLLEAGVQFLYVEIFGTDYSQETFGAPQQNMFLETGTAWLHVMTKSGQGSETARGYCGALMNLFREQPIPTANGTVFMRNMSQARGEPGEDFPGYFAMTVTIDWDRRDITDL